ncbi:hypothetical protein A6769_31885 [Nostoc punctiforme NIES-2108]|uniref:Uncharacterized protein n=1 Tax=Nostoc punctiforme NIES-2108 TaxID=1356359 RepID=A0A367R3N0_NOSPU|nr:hypothetical protein A6769_31885 [Nostoc punctiforme NIES-2108]
MDNVLKIVPFRLNSITKRIGFFILGTLLTVLYAQLCHAQSSANSSSPTNSPYSLETIITAVIGAIITIFYLRAMYFVLTYASKTYGLDDEDDDQESTNDNLLGLGAFLLVVVSGFIIAAYGFGWGFLYLGPIICLFGPIVPIVAMELDLKRYKKTLASKAAQQAIREQISQAFNEL